jgi:hypothetical protein
MISSVTTATIAAVTSTAGALGAIAVLLLISFLVSKELASADARPRMQRLSRGLNVAVVPLVMVFAAIVVSRVAQAL